MEDTCRRDLFINVDTEIQQLGKCKVPNPASTPAFVDDTKDAVQANIIRRGLSRAKGREIFFEPAGPRKQLYFDPSKAKVAIVTCGGLCPGLNDVIRAVVYTAFQQYNVPAVIGIKHGLEGFIPEVGHDIVELTPENVHDIHEFGGTILGSSRGAQETEDIVDALERMNISILIIIGGDGTLRAAQKIHKEAAKRKRSIAVIGLPKTIDNDIHFANPSFGFHTAVEKATEAIRCAHAEALGAPNGIGLVKVMGRDSGFIAAQAAIAMQDVDFVLIPESPFDLHGDNGFLCHLSKRICDNGHAVVVVAEGAGQNLLTSERVTDASGNVLHADVASLLQQEIKTFLRAKKMDFTLKFIDPSYIIRSVPANSNDRVYCSFLGINAVHAGMSGRTGVAVSRYHGRFVHIPMHIMTNERKKIDICSHYWRIVLESTGQPESMLNTSMEDVPIEALR